MYEVALPGLSQSLYDMAEKAQNCVEDAINKHIVNAMKAADPNGWSLTVATKVTLEILKNRHMLAELLAYELPSEHEDSEYFDGRLEE